MVKRPQCSSCGKRFTKQPLPVVLGHRKKAFTTDGGHRFCPPEETLRKYQYHISPITGVVRELAKIPIQGLVHTYVCLLYTSPSPRDTTASRMPSSA